MLAWIVRVSRSEPAMFSAMRATPRIVVERAFHRDDAKTIISRPPPNLNAQFSERSSHSSETLPCITCPSSKREDVMERRHFLKIAMGVTASAAAFAASVQAAPLMPHSLNEDGRLPGDGDAHPAVTSGDEVDRLKPEEVRWHRHWGWHRRHWGWRRRHWGWRRRHWRHRYWRRRYW
jgi:hypothetical protein